MTLRVRQSAYFSVSSVHMPAAEMAERIGLEPDNVLVRGSRRLQPRPIPFFHEWAIECRTRSMDVGDQVNEVLARARPHEESICALVEHLQRSEGGMRGLDGELGPHAALQLVRYPDDRRGEADGYQHRLLGWHLDAEALRFLAAVRAEIDADEYGQDIPWWRFKLRRRAARVDDDAVIFDVETGLQVAGPVLETSGD